MEMSSKQAVIRLVCPACHAILDGTSEFLTCSTCMRTYPLVESIPVFLTESEQQTAEFYSDWYQDPYKKFRLDNIGRPLKSHPFIEKHRDLFEKFLYTQFQRERFFRRFLGTLSRSKNRPHILDLGCGGGNAALLRFGNVYGVDSCINPLKKGGAVKDYAMVVNSNAAHLPFESEQFDCIISSDFIGHIPFEEKEGLFREMSRVLRQGGLCAHVIETDSTNFLKRFAKKYQELYKKYFIEGSGGHFGLELPSAVLKRFQTVDLKPVQVKKYYSYVWDIESFIALFDNEYKEKSRLLRSIVFVYSLFCKYFFVKVLATCIIGCFSYLIDKVAPLDTAEGIMVVCVKKNLKVS
jgi:ubiquinone/menaquinone biosynthesis C-methylase UbiE/uncharacterized protein YbaR (Trm112 family)